MLEIMSLQSETESRTGFTQHSWQFSNILVTSVLFIAVVQKEHLVLFPLDVAHTFMVPMNN